VDKHFQALLKLTPPLLASLQLKPAKRATNKILLRTLQAAWYKPTRRLDLIIDTLVALNTSFTFKQTTGTHPEKIRQHHCFMPYFNKCQALTAVAPAPSESGRPLRWLKDERLGRRGCTGSVPGAQARRRRSWMRTSPVRPDMAGAGYCREEVSTYGAASGLFTSGDQEQPGLSIGHCQYNAVKWGSTTYQQLTTAPEAFVL
jgi:hypothetical protein